MDRLRKRLKGKEPFKEDAKTGNVVDMDARTCFSFSSHLYAVMNDSSQLVFKFTYESVPI